MSDEEAAGAGGSLEVDAGVRDKSVPGALPPKSESLASSSSSSRGSALTLTRGASSSRAGGRPEGSELSPAGPGSGSRALALPLMLALLVDLERAVVVEDEGAGGSGGGGWDGPRLLPLLRAVGGAESWRVGG